MSYKQTFEKTIFDVVKKRLMLVKMMVIDGSSNSCASHFIQGWPTCGPLIVFC